MLVQGVHDGVGPSLAEPPTYDAIYAHMIADGTITANRLVEFDASVGDLLGIEVIQTTTANSKLLVGVAHESAVAGQVLLVQVYGVRKDMETDGSVAAAGDQLTSHTDGTVKLNADPPAANDNIFTLIGFALEGDGVGTSADIVLRCM